jgi:cytochrome c oxidase cbb3-type subunit IV
MYTEILRSITGVAIYPVISLVTFVVFFTAMLVWTSRLDARNLTRLSHLPLEESTRDTDS